MNMVLSLSGYELRHMSF